MSSIRSKKLQTSVIKLKPATKNTKLSNSPSPPAIVTSRSEYEPVVETLKPVQQSIDQCNHDVQHEKLAHPIVSIGDPQQSITTSAASSSVPNDKSAVICAETLQAVDSTIFCHVCRLSGTLLSISTTNSNMPTKPPSDTSSSSMSSNGDNDVYSMILIECSVCKVRVHTDCYGMYNCDTLLIQASCSKWLCDPCKSSIDPSTLHCILCANHVSIHI